MKKAQLKNRIDVSNKRKKADLVIRHASIVNVFTKTLTTGDVAINDGVIVGIGDYEGIEEIDATTVILPNWRAQVDGYGNLIIHGEWKMING